MTDYNDIGINKTLNKARIRKLLSIGLIAAVLVLIGDMLLGWSVIDENSDIGVFSKFIGISDARIFWSALLGMIGIPLEGLCYFGIYRLIAYRSEKRAHSYRTGILGVLTFGGFVHVMCCAAVYYLNRIYELKPEILETEVMQFAKYFLFPASIVFFIFFLVLNITQIAAFIKGETPCPKWCAVFNPAIGVIVIVLAKIIGNYPLVNALSTGWISIGGICTFGGLLLFGLKNINLE